MRLETRYIDTGKSISIIDRNFYIAYIDNLRQHYQLVENGISPLETIFNSDVIYEGPSHNMNPGLVDSIRYVTNAAFSPGDADQYFALQFM